MSPVFSDLRVEENLQKQVSKLLLEVGPMLAINGIDDFIDLLQCVPADGLESLFPIPGATPW